MSPSNINPIIPGFSPDPSLVLVNGTYFLVTSSFHMFPGLPIYASQDLISWKQIGNAIHRRSQLSLALSDTRLLPVNEYGDIKLSTGGLYAPTIRHKDETFYIVCTNVIHEDGNSIDMLENFILSTTDIWSGKWSNPIYFEFDGIDPSIFFDDDGKVYIQGSKKPGPMTRIHMFEIDLETGKKLSEGRDIWNGTGGIYPEGPHMHKKDGFYYIVISEGGTHDSHMVTISRSKDIWGPYEPFDKNPILTAKGKDEYIKYTGHSDIVRDNDGQWWAVCLGVRKDEEGRYIMGRETFLTPGSWNEGKWLALDVVRQNPVVNGKELRRLEGTHPLTALAMVDLLYIRDANLGHHKFCNDGNTVTLTASLRDFSQCDSPVTFVGKRQRLLYGTTTVTMHRVSSQIREQLKAGIAYYKDEHRYVKLYYDFAASEMVFEIINNARSISRKTQAAFDLQTQVTLRVEYTERILKFSYENGLDWTYLGSLDTIEMTGPDFVGPVIGVFATADTEGVQVQFDNLDID